MMMVCLRFLRGRRKGCAGGSAIPKTCSNSPCSVPMWILRKSEIVRKSGSLPAANTLKGMSSCNRFWIRRELNTPVHQ